MYDDKAGIETNLAVHQDYPAPPVMRPSEISPAPVAD